MQSSETSRPVDAVIVLANLMDADGVLNEESQLRAAMAVDVFLAKQARNLVTCGWAYREDLISQLLMHFAVILLLSMEYRAIASSQR